MDWIIINYNTYKHHKTPIKPFNTLPKTKSQSTPKTQKFPNPKPTPKPQYKINLIE